MHVHAGNVVIDGDNCRLLDVENSLLGIPSLHRCVYTQLHKLHVRIKNTCENKAIINLLLVKDSLTISFI